VPDVATYAHSSGSGTLTQANGDLAVAGVDSKYYVFNYTVSAKAGDPVCTVTTAFGDSAVGLTETNGTHSTYFLSDASASSADFVISCTSDSGDDTITFDDMSLQQQLGSLQVNSIDTVNAGVPLALQPDGGPVTTGAGIRRNLVSKTNADTPYAMTLADEVILCDTSVGVLEIDLVACGSADLGKVVDIKCAADCDSNPVTVDPDGTDQIDQGGAGTPVTITGSYDNLTLICGAAGYWSIL